MDFQNSFNSSELKEQNGGAVFKIGESFPQNTLEFKKENNFEIGEPFPKNNLEFRREFEDTDFEMRDSQNTSNNFKIGNPFPQSTLGFNEDANFEIGEPFTKIPSKEDPSLVQDCFEIQIFDDEIKPSVSNIPTKNSELCIEDCSEQSSSNTDLTQPPPDSHIAAIKTWKNTRRKRAYVQKLTPEGRELHRLKNTERKRRSRAAAKMREYNEQMEFLRDQGSLFGFDFQKIESLVEKPPEPGKENPPRNNEENIIDKDYFETFPNEALEHLYRILPKSAKLNFKPTLDGILKNRFTPEEIELRSNKRETKIREFREQMKILRDQTSHTVFDLEKIESFLNNYTGVIEDRDLDVDYFQTLDKQTLQNIYEMVPKVSRQIFLNAIKKNILTPVQRQLKRMNDVERKRRQRAAMKMQEFKNQLIAFVGQSSQFEQDFMKIELFLGNSSENNEDRDHILNYFQRFDDLALQQLFKILPTNHKEVIKPIFDIIQFKRYTPDNTGLQEVINIIPENPQFQEMPEIVYANAESFFEESSGLKEGNENEVKTEDYFEIETFEEKPSLSSLTATVDISSSSESAFTDTFDKSTNDLSQSPSKRPFISSYDAKRSFKQNLNEEQKLLIRIKNRERKRKSREKLAKERMQQFREESLQSTMDQETPNENQDYLEGKELYQSDFDEATTWMVTKLKEMLNTYKEENVFTADESLFYYKCVPDKIFSYKKENDSLKEERATVLFCTNMSGTEKLPPLIIGNINNPDHFEEIYNLPIVYLSNTKSLMKSSILRDWLLNLDQKFRANFRNVLIFLNNHHRHWKDVQTNLTNIKIEYLPQNLSFSLQPMEMGITRLIKIHYRNEVLCDIISNLMKKKSYEISLFDFIKKLSYIWETKISKDYLRHCFDAAGFLESDSKFSIKYSINDENLIQIAENNFKIVKATMEIEEEFLDFLDIDENVGKETLMEGIHIENNPMENIQNPEGVVIKTEVDLEIAEVKNIKTEPDVENTESVSKCEMLESLQKLYNGFSQQENVPEYFFSTISEMTSFLNR